ncbi:glycoside hydrolase family 2 protein [Tunicatimonas pelagia]|uniref:glycoside hydrolase family 2 protein n=1 Tax=Tunicatimonas pelagia TaxID=931531 RepID=UPI00266642E8|nr:glycoside hydrolase family 2 TIM barrel-domain containing protein [Tunicatimonas pelagia]WKN44872.1 glycoside hydrolase family 2 TIM barrel-domain containing protein [Tunicatimonas pelagia]
MTKIFTLFALLGLPLCLPAQNTDSVINQDWRFVKGHQYNMQKNPPWQSVNLPHTWNAEDALAGQLDYYRGPGWYEKELYLAGAYRNQRLFLLFEGSNAVTDVFVNHQLAGRHQGGYTAFCLEITDLVKLDTINTLSVKVNNAYDASLMPLTGDFNHYGGLYRPVHLLVKPPVCISPLDDASSGIYIRQDTVSSTQAQLTVTTLVNSTSSAAAHQVKVTVKDAAGQTVTQQVKEKSVLPDTTTTFTSRLTIDNPHLWQGRPDPYLYQVQVTLQDQRGEIIEEKVQPLGLRYFRLDAEQGFFFNGEYLDLRGVNRHQDRANVGSAITEAHMREDVQIMLEMGVNAVRLAHYPHADYFYQLCDSAGLIVWTELPWTGPGGYRGQSYIASEAFHQTGKQQLREMIRQRYNHPSIVFWGLYNEVKADWDDPYPYLTTLDSLAYALDPDRMTVAAAFQENRNNGVTDAIGWNKYFGWYGGEPKQIGTWADEQHTRHLDRRLCLSEYGAGASMKHHSDTLKAPKPAGRWHPEGWQAYFHEQYWPELAKRPFLWGKFIWLMFDNGAAHRREGDRMGINDKGLVTFDRQTKKDAYYYYQSQWSEEPMVYIADRRFTSRSQADTEVKVYSNQSSLTLYHNGKRVKPTEESQPGVFRWPLMLQSGDNEISVKTTFGEASLTDTVVWSYEP